MALVKVNLGPFNIPDFYPVCKDKFVTIDLSPLDALADESTGEPENAAEHGNNG
jgi:hypothetical protein